MEYCAGLALVYLTCDQRCAFFFIEYTIGTIEWVIQRVFSFLLQVRHISYILVLLAEICFVPNLRIYIASKHNRLGMIYVEATKPQSGDS